MQARSETHDPPRKLEAAIAAVRRHPRTVLVVQVVAFALFVGLAAWAISGDFRDAGSRLRNASVLDFVAGCGAMAAYYLLFVIGWMRILAAWGIRIDYPTALRAEMVSMLAKYVPGGVWTPAARVVALRKAGVTDTGPVTASIFIEAGVSAVAGVLVFVVSLVWVHDVHAPLAPLIAFAVLLVILLHPRVFGPLASRILRRFGGHELPSISLPTLIGLLAFYCGTWLVGGVGLWFMVQAVGGQPALSTVAFMGGVGAVGAIVAVLAIFAPSGLGPREASMVGLLLAIVPEGAAIGATVLNRLALTIVEIALLVVGGLIFRLSDRFATAPPRSRG